MKQESKYFLETIIKRQKRSQKLYIQLCVFIYNLETQRLWISKGLNDASLSVDFLCDKPWWDTVVDGLEVSSATETEVAGLGSVVF